MSRLPALRAGSEFRRAYSQGRRARRDGVTVFVVPGGGVETRAGIVVPSRVGGAVERNRVKRRIRAILGELELRARSDVVIRAEPSTRSLSFQELENHLTEAMSAAGGLA